MHKNTIIVRKESKKQAVKKVSIISIMVNLFFMLAKFFVGNLTNSQALIADSLHSFEDMVSSIISLIGINISTKKANIKHPYGYGKTEYVFSMIISILMMMAGISLVKSLLINLTTSSTVIFNIWAIIICILNIIIKTFLYLYTTRKLNQTNNILIRANREDQRNDILITSSVLISSILSKYGMYWLDYLLGILICIWIFGIGVKIFFTSYNILIDSNITENRIKEIKSKILLYDEVENVDSVVGKPIGDKYVLIIKIAIKKELKIYKCYDIQKDIKNMLLKYEYVHDVIINIRPY